MSKNFELMQEMLRDAGGAREATPAPSPFLFPGIAIARAFRRGSRGFDHHAQEECLKLVQRVFLTQPATSKVIVFAAIDQGGGCSRICAETARILAANISSSVCVVDADFRTPSLAEYFAIPNHRGLSNCLREDGRIIEFAKQLKPSNLWLLSAGASAVGSPSLLNSERLKERLKELRQEFNYVLIDAPALNLHADAITMARNADGVVIVLKADSTRRESALSALDSLRQANVEVLGAVLNRRTFPIPGFLYCRL